jgi:hypothetical protein
MPPPPPPPARLEAQARALSDVIPETVTEAVQASHAAAAPAGAQDQALARHEGLLDTLLDRAHEFSLFMEKAGPLLALVEEAAGSASPGAGAVVARVQALEGFAADLVASLGNHFSGKLSLPAPPVA